MLILTRRTGERLSLQYPDGTVIWVEVLGVKGSQVRLGITAPKNVPVHREEIHERIQRELAGGDDEPNGNR